MRLPGQPENMCEGIFVGANKPPVCAQQVRRAQTYQRLFTPRLHLGSVLLFSSRGRHKMSFFLSGRPCGTHTHTQAQICPSYLIFFFHFSPCASVQPYLDTIAPIFCAGISLIWPLIAGNRSCDNRYFGLRRASFREEKEAESEK